MQERPFSLNVLGAAAAPEALVLNPKSTVAPGAITRFQDSGRALSVLPCWSNSALQVWLTACSPGRSQVSCQGETGSEPVFLSFTVTVEPLFQGCEV